MAELFSPPLIQAQSWEEAQRKFNEVIQQLVRQFNNIYSGANIPTSRIKADAITGAKIADDAVDSEHIADDAVVNAAVGADAITTTEIADDAITTPKIAANQVTAAKIAANTITAAEIAALTITAAQIVAGTITATEMTIATLDAIAVNVGTLTAGTITSGITINAGVRTVMDYTVSTDCTNFTISSLTGDTDEEWNIHCLWKRNGTSAANFGIQPNADTGANYGFRTKYGAGASESAVLTYVNTAYTYLWVGRADTDHYYSQGYGKMNTKSGFIRQLMGLFSRDLTGATANGLYTMADIWNNTADEITSMLFLCSAADGIHAGSRVFAYKRVA